MEAFLLIFAKYSNVLAFIITVVLTMLLVYLIYFRTEKLLKEYAEILLHSAIVDFVSTLAFCYCQTQLEFREGYLFSRSASPFPTLPGQLKCVYPVLYGLFYNISYLPIPIQSFFRYLCLCRNKKPKLLAFRIIYVVFLALLIPSGYHYLVGFVPIQACPQAETLLSSMPFWENASGLDRFCVARLYTSEVIVYLFVLNILAGAGLAVIFFSFWKCYRYLKSHQIQMNKKTIQTQYQLIFRLGLQTILPLFLFINTIILCSVPYWSLDNDGGIYIYLFLPYPWIGVVNAVATIVSIRSYRSSLLSWLTCGLRKSKVNSISVNPVKNIATSDF